MWIFLDCLSVLLFPPVSYSAVLLQSVDCFCSSSHPFRFSLSIVSSINRFSSRRFHSSPLIVPLQSIDCFCSSRLLIASLIASFALVRRLVLLFSLKDLGGVRRKKVA